MEDLTGRKFGKLTVLKPGNSARMETEKNIYGPFLEWYAENYPEKWEEFIKILENE